MLAVGCIAGASAFAPPLAGSVRPRTGHTVLKANLQPESGGSRWTPPVAYVPERLRKTEEVGEKATSQQNSQASLAVPATSKAAELQVSEASSMAVQMEIAEFDGIVAPVPTTELKSQDSAAKASLPEKSGGWAPPAGYVPDRLRKAKELFADLENVLHDLENAATEQGASEVPMSEPKKEAPKPAAKKEESRAAKIETEEIERLLVGISIPKENAKTIKDTILKDVRNLVASDTMPVKSRVAKEAPKAEAKQEAPKPEEKEEKEVKIQEAPKAEAKKEAPKPEEKEEKEVKIDAAKEIGRAHV